MTTFTQFRENPEAIEKCQLLMGISLADVPDWAEFRRKALSARAQFGGPDGGRPFFVEHARKVCDEAENYELALYFALLHAMDYRWLADDIAQALGVSFLKAIEFSSGNALRAAAACVGWTDIPERPEDRLIARPFGA